MVIGLNGRMGAGKNTVAERLAVLHGNVVEVSFARKLKESVAALLNIPVASLELWKNDPSKCVAIGGLYDGLGFVQTQVFTIREILQRYGTESHRDVFGEDFWLDAALPLPAHAGEFARYKNALYVVTDMRFPNEAERVKDVGGITVQVIGPDIDTGEHRSELPLVCDVTIDNSAHDGYDRLDMQLRSLLATLTLPLAA